MFYLCKSCVNLPQSYWHFTWSFSLNTLQKELCYTQLLIRRSLIYHCPASLVKVYVAQCYYIRVPVFQPTCYTAANYYTAARHAELNSPLVYKIQNLLFDLVAFKHLSCAIWLEFWKKPRGVMDRNLIRSQCYPDMQILEILGTPNPCQY